MRVHSFGEARGRGLGSRSTAQDRGRLGDANAFRGVFRPTRAPNPPPPRPPPMHRGIDWGLKVAGDTPAPTRFRKRAPGRHLPSAHQGPQLASRSGGWPHDCWGPAYPSSGRDLSEPAFSPGQLSGVLRHRNSTSSRTWVVRRLLCICMCGYCRSRHRVAHHVSHCRPRPCSCRPKTGGGRP